MCLISVVGGTHTNVFTNKIPRYTVYRFSFSQFKDTNGISKEVCRQCYNTLTLYLKGDSRKNENYLARYICIFQEQV